MNCQIRVLVATVALGVFAGCGLGPASLEGRVEFADGTPLCKGELIFDSGSYSEFAPIGAQGRFKTMKGLPKGTYKVTVRGVTGGTYEKPTLLVDERYSRSQTTDLEVTVDGRKQDVVLTVTGPRTAGKPSSVDKD